MQWLRQAFGIYLEKWTLETIYFNGNNGFRFNEHWLQIEFLLVHHTGRQVQINKILPIARQCPLDGLAFSRQLKDFIAKTARRLLIIILNLLFVCISHLFIITYVNGVHFHFENLIQDTSAPIESIALSEGVRPIIRILH